MRIGAVTAAVLLVAMWLSPVHGQAPPPAKTEQAPRLSVKTSLDRRGTVEERFGVSLSAEMTSHVQPRIQAGIGLEFQMFQSQKPTNTVLSFLPIYWVARLNPFQQDRRPYVVTRLGFDLLGQTADDTLSGRQYYGAGLGMLFTPADPKSLQAEVLYSLDQGTYRGLSLSIGYRF